MGIVRKVLLGLKIRAGCIFSLLLKCFWMALTLQNLKLGENLEFSWYSCNILRYCSNRCIVWFYIPENCPSHANRKFPVQLGVKIQILFEPPFWICKWANDLSFLLCLFLRNSTEERVGKMNGTVITNRLQNSFIIKDNNVYGSSYYWNFRTLSFKQVACLVLYKKWQYRISQQFS
jgi:hypothetical protein